MNILLVLKVISVVLEMIASGISEGEAIGKASAMFGVSKNFIRKFLKIKINKFPLDIK